MIVQGTQMMILLDKSKKSHGTSKGVWSVVTDSSVGDLGKATGCSRCRGRNRRPVASGRDWGNSCGSHIGWGSGRSGNWDNRSGDDWGGEGNGDGPACRDRIRARREGDDCWGRAVGCQGRDSNRGGLSSNA